MPMNLDEELLMDEEENRRERQFVRQQLPAELKEKYSDDALQWILDTVVEYYFSSGILESADDEIDIDLEQVAAFVCKQAKDEGRPDMLAQEVFFVVQADLDFQEKNT